MENENRDTRICTLVRELLPQYNANACSGEVQTEIDAHLRECDACDQAYADVHASAKELEIERFIKKKKRRKLIGGGSLILAGILAVGIGIQAYRNTPVTEIYTSPENLQGYLIRKGDDEGQVVRVEYEVVWEKGQNYKTDDRMRLETMNLTVTDESGAVLLEIRPGEEEVWFPSMQEEDGTVCCELMSFKVPEERDEFFNPTDHGNFYALADMESFLLYQYDEYLLACPATEKKHARWAVEDFTELFGYEKTNALHDWRSELLLKLKK